MDDSALDGIVVGGRILAIKSALFQDNEINLRRGISYLNALNLQWGVAVNFGKKTTEFTAFHADS